MISLDPGVCTFMTSYDPSGIAVEWGKNDIDWVQIMSCIWQTPKQVWSNSWKKISKNVIGKIYLFI